jgi:hypothetical protein
MKIHNKFPELLAGDIILVHGKGWFSRAILFVEQFLPEGAGRAVHKFFRASHEATVFSPGIVVEEVNGMRLAPLREYLHTRVEIYRYRHSMTDQRTQVANALIGLWGQEYGWGEIFLFLLNAIFHTYWFTHTFRSRLKVCSQAGAWSWQMVLRRPFLFGGNWRDMDPERLAIVLERKPQEWERVFATEPDSHHEEHEVHEARNWAMGTLG